MKKNIGIEVKEPEKKCDDKNCAFHGNISIRGRTFVGIVKAARATKTATVVWERKSFLPKYERYERRRTSVKAHNPECLNAKIGDKVKIMECKPLSKTKKFVIVEVMK
jgi:small subunit ribosomal protein S17